MDVLCAYQNIECRNHEIWLYCRSATNRDLSTPSAKIWIAGKNAEAQAHVTARGDGKELFLTPSHPYKGTKRFYSPLMASMKLVTLPHAYCTLYSSSLLSTNSAVCSCCCTAQSGRDHQLQWCLGPSEDLCLQILGFFLRRGFLWKGGLRSVLLWQHSWKSWAVQSQVWSRSERKSRVLADLTWKVSLFLLVL